MMTNSDIVIFISVKYGKVFLHHEHDDFYSLHTEKFDNINGLHIYSDNTKVYAIKLMISNLSILVIGDKIGKNHIIKSFIIKDGRLLVELSKL